MKNKIRHLSVALLLLTPGIMNQEAVAQDRYWPLDGNKRLNTNNGTVSTYGGVSVPTDFFPTVYSTNAEVLFSMYAGLTFPYDNVPNRVVLDAYGAVQAFAIPGACKKYGILDVYYVPTPHGHAVTFRTVDASAVVNNITTTPLPTVTAPTGIFGGASGAAGQYGALAAPLNEDGTRYIYHLNFGTTLNRYTVSYTGTVGSATTITTSLPNCTGRMNISGDGKSIAFVNTSNQLVTYDLTNPATPAYTYTGVTFSSGNNKCMQQVTYNGERRWYVSTGSALGYVVEGSSTFNTISTTVGLNSSLAHGQNGMIYFAEGVVGFTPGYIYYFNPGATSIYFSFPLGQVVGATFVSGATTSCVRNGAYYFGNHVEGEDISSFPTAPITIAFTLNGVYLDPSHGVVTAYNCKPVVMRRSASYHNYQIRITAPGNEGIVYYNSGVKQGRLPDSLDARNLCGLGGTGTCNYLTGKTGQYDIRVTYNNSCGGGGTTTVIRVNLIPAVSDLTLKVNNQTGIPDIVLCNGSNDLKLQAADNGYMTGYQIRLDTGSLAGGNVFVKSGTSYLSSVFTADTIPEVNLRTLSGSFLNGYTGYVQATAITFDSCGSYSDSIAFRLRQLRTPDSVSFTLNGHQHHATPPRIRLCQDTLSLIPRASDHYDSFIVVLERGTLEVDGITFTPDPNIDPKSDTLADTAFPADLVQHFPTYLTQSGGMYYGALRVSVMAKGSCGVSAPRIQTYMLEKATPADSLAYTLNGIANGTDPVNILLCGSEDSLTLSPSAVGTISGYHIRVEKGTWNAGVFTDSGSLDSASIATGNFPLDLAAQFADYLYPDDTIYRGDLRVTVTTQGPCLPPKALSQVYRIRHGEPIADLDFTVNDTFQLAELSPAPEVWMCNDTSLTLRTTFNGTPGDSFTITLQKGTFDVVNGFDGGFTSPISRTVAATDSIEIYDVPAFKTYLGGNPGIVQVTVSAAGPCNVVPASKDQVFDVKSAIAFVDFRMIGTVGNPRQPRNTSLAFPNLLQPVITSIPPDSLGWLGANSVGVYVDSTRSPATIDSHYIVVSQINLIDTSEILPLIVDYAGSGNISLTTNYSFDFYSLISGIGYKYFTTAYDTVKNNYVFKVTVHIKTQQCGYVGNYSYFKIIDGIYGTSWKPVGLPLEDGVLNLTVYPNPTKNLVNFVWEGTKQGYVSIQDITGKTILKKVITKTNGSSVFFDIVNLTSGIYLYKAELDGEVCSGKIEKY